PRNFAAGAKPPLRSRANRCHNPRGPPTPPRSVPMKIALLARNPSLYSHRRICEAARARGHEIEVINTLRVSINITSRKPALYYRKRRLEGFDAVIPRIGASVTFYGLAV